ncbi:glycosyltransferase [Vreelandella rituensis]
MAKQAAVPAPANQKRKPRLLWANPSCLLDTSSGASMSVRQMLHQLVGQGYEVQVLGATIFDDVKGMGRLKEQHPDFKKQLNQLIEAKDDSLTHQLLVTYSSKRRHLTSHEEELWHGQYLYLLDSFKPDVVWYYGGQTLETLIPDEARSRGIPSAFYLANGNYKATRWCRDIDLILTDSQATADMYRQDIGFVAKPVGKFIDPATFVAEHHERKRLLYVNPSWVKGASIVVQLALQLERARPDIEIEVVEARADWAEVLRETSKKLGQERKSLPNIIVTPNTSDMCGPYSRARVLLAPSLWWESSGRVLAEAMLNSIPALITNRGGMPEMIDDAGIAFDFPEECYEEPHQYLLNDEELQPLLNAVIVFYDDEALYQTYVERAKRVGEQKHHIDKATQRLVNAFTPLVKQRAGNKDFTFSERKRHRHNLTSVAGKPEFKVDTSFLRMVQGKHSNAKTPTRPLAAPDFDWQISGKVIVLDNRAKLIKTGASDKLAALGAFGIVAFDPASEIDDPKQYEGSETIQVFQHALLGDGKPSTLYTCLAPEMSSTLVPLPEVQLPEHRRQGAKVLTKLPINTIALDSIEGLGSLDWLILDDLSDAATILGHGKEALKDTLLIQARVAFQPTHEKQPSLAELQYWASRNGFRFYRFNDMKFHSLFNAEVGESPYQATELESADAVFLPSEERLKSLSDESKIKLSFVLDVIFEAKDARDYMLSFVTDKRKIKPARSKNNLKICSTIEIIKSRDFLYESARKELTIFLNDYHGLEKGARFWDIVLHYFLGQRFIQAYLSRWNNELLNERSGERVTSLFPCANLMEFGKLTYNRVDDFSPYVSDYFDVAGVAKERANFSIDEKSEENFNSLKRHIKNNVKGGQGYAFDLGAHSHVYWRDKLKKEKIDLVFIPSIWVGEKKYIDWPARCRIARKDLENPLEGFNGFWTSLALSLPGEFMELFPEMLDRSERIEKKYSPEVIVSTQLASTFSRIIAALYAEKGVPLHLQQHGGAYGEYSSHAGVYEKRISDVFYTWGWHDESEKTIPAPQHRLEHLANSYQEAMKEVKAKDEILIIGPNRPKIPNITDGTDCSPYNNKDIFDFLRELDASSYEKVVFRFRRQHGFDPSYEKNIINLLPEGAILDDQNRPIEKAYARAKKVIIVDPFTTSAWECEYLGIPYRVLNQPSEEFIQIPSFISEVYE